MRADAEDGVVQGVLLDVLLAPKPRRQRSVYNIQSQARGAVNAVFALSDEEAARGVVTHSSGNHAAAIACVGIFGCVMGRQCLRCSGTPLGREAFRATL